MRYPKERINLADALGGKIANEKPLAIDDKVIIGTGDEEYRILGQVNTRRIFVKSESSPLVWGHTIEAVNRNSLTEDEAKRLLCPDKNDQLENWRRLNPDGSKTPLSEIYAERVDVGVGSWIKWRSSIMQLVKRSSNEVAYVVNAHGDVFLGGGSVVVENIHALTPQELVTLLGLTTSEYTLLPPADALKMLAEMEESR